MCIIRSGQIAALWAIFFASSRYYHFLALSRIKKPIFAFLSTFAFVCFEFFEIAAWSSIVICWNEKTMTQWLACPRRCHLTAQTPTRRGGSVGISDQYRCNVRSFSFSTKQTHAIQTPLWTKNPIIMISQKPAWTWIQCHSLTIMKLTLPFVQALLLRRVTALNSPLRQGQ